MATGIFETKRKDGTTYYRANISFRGKHISLGSADNASVAQQIYTQAKKLVTDEAYDRTLPTNIVTATERLQEVFASYPAVSSDKLVSIVNLRDNGIYIGTPIYLLEGYFLYFLSDREILKFDRDDLFYYSNHRIMKRGGHLYVNDFGMQVSLIDRYGIRSHGVSGIDYRFANGDETDFRYENIEIINPWHGVFRQDENGQVSYLVKIHIEGYWQVGIYQDAITAAIAYNKAVDAAKAAGVTRNYAQNYIVDMSARKYAEIYTAIRLSSRLMAYLEKERKKA